VLAAAPVPDPAGARITSGTCAAPPSMKWIFAAWLTIWSIAQVTKSENCSSTTGAARTGARRPGTDDRDLRDRGVAHPLAAEPLEQAGGDAERPAVDADVLAHAGTPARRLHQVGQGLADRLGVGQLPCRRPGAGQRRRPGPSVGFSATVVEVRGHAGTSTGSHGVGIGVDGVEQQVRSAGAAGRRCGADGSRTASVAALRAARISVGRSRPCARRLEAGDRVALLPGGDLLAGAVEVLVALGVALPAVGRRSRPASAPAGTGPVDGRRAPSS
jgi:hypothetical protein